MNTTWTLAAACRGYDPELWFSDDAEDQAAAKSVCARCPVLENCGSDALATDGHTAYGIRAGLTGRQRTEARRHRLRAQLATP